MPNIGSPSSRIIRPRTTITTRAIPKVTLLLFIVGAITLIGDIYFLFNLRSTSIQGRSEHENPVYSTTTTDNNNNNNKDELPSLRYNQTVVAHWLRSTGAIVPDETKLPTWAQIVDLYGPGPVILGLEQCERFRNTAPAEERMLGAAGMFSTGTNLMTHLLKRNCYIPERAERYGLETATKEQLGMRWQVPWGKHTPADYKFKHATEKAQQINKDYILPCVTIRSPWRWMQSMCKNPYTARWSHTSICPHLVTNSSSPSHWEWNPVSVKYGAGIENYASLVHLWIQWYNHYVRLIPVENNESDVPDDTYPVLLVRMEDLVFYTQETVTQICQCAGGIIYPNKPFEYVVESAKKDSPGHDTSVGLTEAWIKYSKPLQPQAGFVLEDYQAGLYALNHDDRHGLMERLRYLHPPLE